MTKISSRQLFFFLAAVAPVGKIAILPTQLAYYAKNDLLLPAAMNFLLQAGVIFLVLLAAKSNLSFFELIKRKLGTTTARIVLTVFSVFFFYTAFFALLEQKLFVQSVFYDTLPSVFAFSSFFVFSAYVTAKPLSSHGRIWDILAPLAIAAFAGILIFSVGAADYGALAPAFASGAGGIFKGFAYSMSWFTDSALVLSFLGKIDYKKGLAWKGTLCYLAGALVTLFFLATFYGVFQEIALRQQFAFTKISKYFAGIQVLGRIDYLFIFSLSLVMAFYAVLPIKAGVDLLQQAYTEEDNRVFPALFSVGINALMLVLSILCDYRFRTVDLIVNQTLFWIFPVFTLLLPALVLLFTIRRQREKVK